MIQNPILKGFCPDPSIIRVGEDYYIATSTFEWWPGVKLFHSKDLKNWEQIPSPLRRESQLNMIGNPTSGGVWAPCLSYDGTYYYLVYTDVKTKKKRYYNTHNYLVYTDDIYGDWSEPVYLNSIGFDPSLFHDTDGRKYLINMVNGFKGILVQEIELEETNKKLSAYRKPVCRFIGERKKVYAGSGIGCTEGPHMYHIGEWYYLIVAEGGTGYDHCVTMARSKSVWGPFETAPNNPILTSDKSNFFALQKCGHADITDTPEGEWYMVHLCSRPLGGQKWCTLGRETAIQKMRWREDGWMETANGSRFAAAEAEELKRKEPLTAEGQKIEAASENHQIAETETAKQPDQLLHVSFDNEMLPVCFVSPRSSYDKFIDLTSRSGYLRILGQESMNSLHHVSLVAVKQQAACVQAETVMEFCPDYPEQLAGLTYMYDAMNFYILGKTAAEDGTAVLTLIKSDAGVITDEMEQVPVSKNQAVKLMCRIVKRGMAVQFYYQCEGDSEWKLAGKELSTELVTDEHCRGFTGAHFGMYVHDMTGLGYYADYARFDVFEYGAF